jgi:hypothetical protein
VFPVRYELNSYIVFRKRLVSKRLMHEVSQRLGVMQKQPTSLSLQTDGVVKRCIKRPRNSCEKFSSPSEGLQREMAYLTSCLQGNLS